MKLSNRIEAGKKLAQALKKYQGEHVVIYGIPRGGVVLAYEVATHLHVPLDVVIVRKVAHPLSLEYAIGAVAEHEQVLSDEVASEDWIKRSVQEKKQEVLQRKQRYVAHEPQSLEGKTAIIVDDGVATGLTMKAAIQEIKRLNPGRIVIAVPVAPQEFVDEMRREKVELVVLHIPKIYAGSVGAYYTDFPEVTDDEVLELLKKVTT